MNNEDTQPRSNILMNAMIRSAVAFSMMMFTTGVAFAQTPPTAPSKDQPAAKPAAGGKEGKKTSVNFEDQLIEGQTQKPELFYLLQNRNNNFKRLIKLRENFLP